MTTREINYWTHETREGTEAHQWRYLGKTLQTYHCVVCQLRVSKADLKGNTDA